MTEQNFTIEDLNNEIWMPINERYEASNLGRVRYVNIISQRVSNTGYLRVGLTPPKRTN